jgi:hypothetical protein
MGKLSKNTNKRRLVIFYRTCLLKSSGEKKNNGQNSVFVNYIQDLASCHLTVCIQKSVSQVGLRKQAS